MPLSAECKYNLRQKAKKRADWAISQLFLRHLRPCDPHYEAEVANKTRLLLRCLHLSSRKLESPFPVLVKGRRERATLMFRAVKKKFGPHARLIPSKNREP